MKVSCLVDKDWIIDYLNDREPVASRLEELRQEGIGVSTISLAELYEGVYGSRSPGDSEMKLLGFLSGIAILGIDEGICKTFGQERGKLRKGCVNSFVSEFFLRKSGIINTPPLFPGNE